MSNCNAGAVGRASYGFAGHYSWAALNLVKYNLPNVIFFLKVYLMLFIVCICGCRRKHCNKHAIIFIYQLKSGLLLVGIDFLHLAETKAPSVSEERYLIKAGCLHTSPVQHLFLHSDILSVGENI